MTTAIRDDTVNHARTARSGEMINADFLKDMIRQHWTAKLENSIDRHHSKKAINDMEVHISNMNQIVDQLDYELFCMPSIINHAKNMTSEELSQYLKMVESLAIGYSSIVGRDITNLLMIGVTSKAKNVNSIERYYGILSNDIESKIKHYYKLLEHNKRHVDRISMKARLHQGGILRFFRRKRIAHLHRRMDKGIRKIERISEKLDRANDIHRSIKLKANKD